MQDNLYQTADAGVSLLDSGCRSISIRQRIAGVCQTADAGYTPLGSGCRRPFIRERMQETLNQTVDAGNPL